MEEILRRLARREITPNEARTLLNQLGTLPPDEVDFHLKDVEDNRQNYLAAEGDAPSAATLSRRALREILPISRERTQAGRGLAARAAQEGRFGGGPFSGFAEQAMGRAFDPGDLMSRFLLNRFGIQQPGAGLPTQAPTGSFEAFARTQPVQPDPNTLASQARNILAELEGFAGREGVNDPRKAYRQALEGVFSNPDAAFNAAIQPVLASIAPALEAAFLGQAGRDYQSTMARDPSRFTTPASSFREFGPYYQNPAAGFR